MSRWVDSGDNPFREKDPRNAAKRRELIDAGRKRKEEWNRYLNERSRKGSKRNG